MKLKANYLGFSLFFAIESLKPSDINVLMMKLGQFCNYIKN